MRDIASYTTLCDLDLLSLVKSGDLSAFTEIYNRFSGLLYIYSLKLTTEHDEAEDLVQELFISLWDNRCTLEIKTSVASYLYSAIRYRFLDLLSKKKIRSNYATTFQEFIDRGTFTTDEYINEKELLFLVEKEVSLLPDKMRQVFELSRNAGMSHREIALELDISEKTVRNHVNHALKILRVKLGSLAFFLSFFHW